MLSTQGHCEWVALYSWPCVRCCSESESHSRLLLAKVHPWRQHLLSLLSLRCPGALIIQTSVSTPKDKCRYGRSNMIFSFFRLLMTSSELWYSGSGNGQQQQGGSSWAAACPSSGWSISSHHPVLYTSLQGMNGYKVAVFGNWPAFEYLPSPNVSFFERAVVWLFCPGHYGSQGVLFFSFSGSIVNIWRLTRLMRPCEVPLSTKPVIKALSPELCKVEVILPDLQSYLSQLISFMPCPQNRSNVL